MEAIPKEVIDMAEDFFSRFSDEEKEKMLYEYFKEQQFIGAQCHFWFKAMEDKNSLRNIVSLCLIIYRSYKYYGIKLPVVSIEIFRTRYQNYCKEMDFNGSNGLRTVDSFIEITKDTNQPDLVNHIILKLHGTVDNLVKYTNLNDAGASVAIASMMLLLLNDSTKKQLIN